jgi:hypothetical protein
MQFAVPKCSGLVLAFDFSKKKLSKIFGSKTIKFLPLHPLSKKSESDQIAIFDRIT